MNFRFTVLETSLNRAEFRWKWLRFIQFTSILGICLSFLFMGLGASVLGGWVNAKPVALTFFGIICAAGLIAWIVLAIAVMASEPDRRWLAATIEKVDRRFLDRLNTLLFLEGRRHEARAQSFALRIAKQTQSVLAQKQPPPAFPAGKPLAWFACCLLAVAALLLLNQRYAPWQQLILAQSAKPAPTPPKEAPLDLALPSTNNVEENRPWGEVRITDPGMDLRVTKVDVIPLQIEAAANQRIQSVQWLSAINGSPETQHPLPAPNEPRYAIYRPDIYLDELNLADWDVMTYYARAATEPDHAYASEIYFIEVRPFREDIAKIPGGENGEAYQQLNQLSGLISRQQHIVRQTHQHLRNPPEQENLRAQDRGKLADAENDLGDATRHLYADMASKMENKPIGEALDNLAKAETSLKSAGKQLRDDHAIDAEKDERSALSDLVAARKMFQKAISDNPDAFKEPKDQENEPPPPVADAAKKLNQMAEFRDEAKAAQELMQRTLEQQRSLEQRTRTAPLSQYPRLGEEQQKLKQQLQNFAEQHPAPFKGSEQQARDSQQAMAGAAKSLETRRTAEARNGTADARKQLEKLAENMQSRNTGQQLADAYKLKQMLDQQAQKLADRSQPGSRTSDAEAQKAARDAKQTLEQLKNTAEQEPTRQAFGQPLRDALSGENKSALDRKLQDVQTGGDENWKQQAARNAAKALGQVSDAFSASQPKSLQMARKSDSLKPGDQDSFNQGMSELESMLKQLQKNGKLSKQDQSKQGQQALADLQNGMRSQFGSNERGEQLLQQLQQMLKGDAGLEPGDLRKLMDALQHFSVETSEQLARKDDEPQLNNIDPARLPPAYRSRIQKYFERLSEK